MKFRSYYYYYKNDPNKEAVDKVIASSRLQALAYFAERKQIDEFRFIELYNIEIDETIQPK